MHVYLPELSFDCLAKLNAQFYIRVHINFDRVVLILLAMQL